MTLFQQFSDAVQRIDTLIFGDPLAGARAIVQQERETLRSGILLLSMPLQVEDARGVAADNRIFARIEHDAANLPFTEVVSISRTLHDRGRAIDLIERFCESKEYKVDGTELQLAIKDSGCRADGDSLLFTWCKRNPQAFKTPQEAVRFARSFYDRELGDKTLIMFLKKSDEVPSLSFDDVTALARGLYDSASSINLLGVYVKRLGYAVDSRELVRAIEQTGYAEDGDRLVLRTYQLYPLVFADCKAMNSCAQSMYDGTRADELRRRYVRDHARELSDGNIIEIARCCYSCDGAAALLRQACKVRAAEGEEVTALRGEYQRYR